MVAGEAQTTSERKMKFQEVHSAEEKSDGSSPLLSLCSETEADC